jgi:predicted nucleic acid-binding protein
MKSNILLDTGPLVAIVNRREAFHQWVTQTITNFSSPFFTCEAVITEACFLLQNIYGGEDVIMGLVKSKKIIIPFQFSEEVDAIRDLMQRYQSVPMSFADACLVRMSELIAESSVLTLDSDFYVYRKNRREMIDLIIPD